MLVVDLMSFAKARGSSCSPGAKCSRSSLTIDCPTFGQEFGQIGKNSIDGCETVANLDLQDGHWACPGFVDRLALSVFSFSHDEHGALWKLVETVLWFPRSGGRVLGVHGSGSFHRASRPARVVRRSRSAAVSASSRHSGDSALDGRPSRMPQARRSPGDEACTIPPVIAPP